MRFKHKKWPPSGSMAIVKCFAWLPVETGSETRWLEKVTYIAKVTYWVHALTKERKNWTLEPYGFLDTPEDIHYAEQEYEHQIERFAIWERSRLEDK